MSRRRSRRQARAQPLFEARHGYAYCAEHRLCAECGDPLPKGRRRWCSDECVQDYMIRSDPKWARHAVYRRDKGVCACCGTDTNEIKRLVLEADSQGRTAWLIARGKPVYTIKERPKRILKNPSHYTLGAHQRTARLLVLEPLGLRAWWWRKTWWDMDHVVAVDERGGNCGLDNLQTLCLPCHSKRTSEQRRRWKGRSRRLPRMKNEVCSSGCKLSEDGLCVGCSRYRRRILAVPQKGR